jgi:glutamate carboxypeptidase
VSSNRFDPETILAGILDWVGQESPSYDALAVGKMLDKVAAAFAGLNACVERIPSRSGFADAMKVSIPGQLLPRADGHKDTSANGILVLGHVDTVHPVGTLDGPLPIRREGDRVYGPGILDMKGGLYMAIHALRELHASDTPPQLPVTFLIIPDEEVGSPSSRTLIEREAQNYQYVLVPEPAREGKVVTGRHAFARYVIEAQGVSVHAGADNARGASAISAMAAFVTDVEGRSDLGRGITFSVGIIHGGTFVNVVPHECNAEVLCVAPDAAALEFVRHTMDQLGEEHAAIRIQAGPVRPLFPLNSQGLALFEVAKRLAEDAGGTLEHGQFGGGSDGNFTGALGIPTLDGLGPIGGGPHTHEEYILVSSLGPRCRLFAGLLSTLR